MKDENIQWADVFPLLKYIPTDDPRIFVTRYEKLAKNTTEKKAPKKKTVFCCLTTGSCYGVDVIRPWATNTERETEQAFAKVQRAADYYEEFGIWPKSV